MMGGKPGLALAIMSKSHDEDYGEGKPYMEKQKEDDYEMAVSDALNEVMEYGKKSDSEGFKKAMCAFFDIKHTHAHMQDDEMCDDDDY